MYSDQPPKRPPCDRIAPLARAGISSSAVILLDRFLMFMKVFSSMPCMPSYSVSDLRSPSTSGRPARAGLVRSMVRSSMGNT